MAAARLAAPALGLPALLFGREGTTEGIEGQLAREHSFIEAGDRAWREHPYRPGARSALLRVSRRPRSGSRRGDRPPAYRGGIAGILHEITSRSRQEHHPTGGVLSIVEILDRRG